MITKKPATKKVTKKTSVIKKLNRAHVFYVVKVFFIILVSVSLLYSFAVVPVGVYHQTKQNKLQAQQDKKEKIACHDSALVAASEIMVRVQEANKNLQEGQEPLSVSEVAAYNTQYSLCVRSKGL